MMSLSRYHNQIILPEIGKEGQLKLSNSKVLVVGAGGLGSPALTYLASAGVGNIGVLDFDVVKKTNLHRQVLYNESQIGLYKVQAALDNLIKLNADINYRPHNCFLNVKNGFGIFKEYDIVVDATDNFRTRYLINDICVNLSLPFVMGAINKFEAQIAVLNYADGPTYRCIYPDLNNGYRMINCEDNGVIGPLCGIVGTIQAMEVIKLIINAGDLLSGKILYINSLTMEFKKIKVKRDPSVVAMSFKIREEVSG